MLDTLLRDTQTMERSISQEDEPGSILEFYRDSVVFITGGTGFMGMVLLEKLLRACSVRKVFLLMRAKKGKDIEERLTKMMDDPLFKKVQTMFPNVEKKLHPVEGDCSLPGLGLKPGDRKVLIEEVNLVFHMAATVRFDEPLRQATNINVRGTRDIIELAKQMPNIKALVHVSTAFSHCYRHDIDEIFYESPMPPENLIKLVTTLDDATLEKITPILLDKFPNSYTFTKAIAEDLVQKETKGFPAAIVRPAMVMCTAHEPIQGWVNNINGPAGVVAGAGLGVLRTLYCDKDLKADLVPCDMAINATIASAWDAHKAWKNQTTQENSDKISDAKEVIPVYNYVSSPQNEITWGRFMKINETGMKWASMHVQWYYCFFLTRYWWVHQVLRIFLHYLPAIIVDTVAFVIGRKPMMMKAYKKIHKFTDVVSYFTEKNWQFSNLQVQRMWKSLNHKEQELFPFNIAELDWESVVASMIPGMRMYLIHDPLETLPEARKYYMKLKIAHYTVVTCLLLLLSQILWWIVKLFI